MNKSSNSTFDNKIPCNNLIFIDKIGVVIGKIIGNNKIGKIKDLFLTYIESAEAMVPQIDKSNVGKIIPKKIQLSKELKPKFDIEGTEIKKLKKNRIDSIKLNKIKQKRILLTKIVVVEMGEVSNPPRVPDSFSLTNNLVMINIRVKKIINHISITKISIGIV